MVQGMDPINLSAGEKWGRDSDHQKKEAMLGIMGITAH